MSLILFFGMGILIFIAGLGLIFATFHSGEYMNDTGGHKSLVSGDELDFPNEPPPVHHPV